MKRNNQLNLLDECKASFFRRVESRNVGIDRNMLESVVRDAINNAPDVRMTTLFEALNEAESKINDFIKDKNKGMAP